MQKTRDLQVILERLKKNVSPILFELLVEEIKRKIMNSKQGNP